MRRTWVEQVMGMPASLLLRGDLVGVDEVVAAAYDVLRDVDATFSTYREDSEISRLRTDRLSVEDASPQVRDVLIRCEQARQATDGWFDVDLPGGLDPSGLVKGWAIERTLDVLSELRDVDICLNVGGDVAVRVAEPTAPFVVGIEDPRDRTRLVATVSLTGGGLATSGTSARGLHIVNPHTRTAVAQIASVSVVGPSLMWADVYATAAFARGLDAATWLAGLPSYEGLVVHLDGTTERTPEWLAGSADEQAVRRA